MKDFHLNRRTLVRGAMAAGATTLLPSPGRAANFANQTITIICPFGVGGGSDLWSRFNAPFLSKYLPGKPVVVVKTRVQPSPASLKTIVE